MSNYSKMLTYLAKPLTGQVETFCQTVSYHEFYQGKVWLLPWYKKQLALLASWVLKRLGLIEEVRSKSYEKSMTFEVARFDCESFDRQLLRYVRNFIDLYGQDPAMILVGRDMHKQCLEATLSYTSNFAISKLSHDCCDLSRPLDRYDEYYKIRYRASSYYLNVPIVLLPNMEGLVLLPKRIS